MARSLTPSARINQGARARMSGDNIEALFSSGGGGAHFLVGFFSPCSGGRWLAVACFRGCTRCVSGTKKQPFSWSVWPLSNSFSLAPPSPRHQRPWLSLRRCPSREGGPRRAAPLSPRRGLATRCPTGGKSPHRAWSAGTPGAFARAWTNTSPFRCAKKKPCENWFLTKNFSDE